MSVQNKRLYAIDELTDSNHTAWKQRIELVLQDRGLWKYVTGKCEPPTEKKAFEAWEEKDQAAKAQILLTVSDHILMSVRGAKTSKEAWTKIASTFEQKGLSAQVFLRRKLLSTKFSDREDASMQNHLNGLRELSDRLQAIGVEVKDEELAIIALCSLPPQFDSLIIALEQRPPSDITFEFVSARVLAEASRQSQAEEEPNRMSVGLSARSSYRVSKCSFCKRTGHIESSCWDKYPDKRPKANIASGKGRQRPVPSGDSSDSDSEVFG